MFSPIETLLSISVSVLEKNLYGVVDTVDALSTKKRFDAALVVKRENVNRSAMIKLVCYNAVKFESEQLLYLEKTVKAQEFRW